MHKLLQIAGACVLLASAGCASHHQYRHPHGLPPGHAKKMVHVHSVGCDHELLGGVWVEHSVKHAKVHKHNAKNRKK